MLKGHILIWGMEPVGNISAEFKLVSHRTGRGAKPSVGRHHSSTITYCRHRENFAD